MRAPLAALLLVSLLLLPLAEASNHRPGGGFNPMLVEVESPRGLFSPLGGYASINLTVKVDCILAASDAPMNFSVRDKPDWLWVKTMPGWYTYINNFTGYKNLPCDAATQYVTIKETMLANFTSQAPAYRLANFTVVVTRSGDVKQATGAMQPAYYGNLQVIPPPQILRLKPQDSKADLAFRVRNLGNGETTVRLTYVNPTGVRVDAPDVMILGAAQQGGDWDKPLNVRLFIDEVRDDFTIAVNATGFSRNSSNPRPALASEASTVVDLQRQLPSPGLLAAFGAASIAVLVAGRRARR